jgi:hypothetical protein
MSLATTPVFATALAALAAGISVVPIQADGSKQPALRSWKEYQQRRPSRYELERWFRVPGPGIALVTGAVSCHLEALDFDDNAMFTAWLSHIQRDQGLWDLFEYIATGYEETTPARGRHVLYRCSEAIEGNQKLAVRPEKERGYKSLIETRGEGGYVIVDPSRGCVHPSGRPYLRLRGGVGWIRTITPEQRVQLLSAARSFNEVSPPEPRVILVKRPGPADPGLRPGDLYNQYATWEEILIPHGWELVRTQRSGVAYWRRPGKRSPGISATTNWNGSDRLYVFSTATIFEAERGYTKFEAYTLLYHHGDFTAAARELIRSGYIPAERLRLQRSSSHLR